MRKPSDTQSIDSFAQKLAGGTRPPRKQEGVGAGRERWDQRGPEGGGGADRRWTFGRPDALSTYHPVEYSRKKRARNMLCANFKLSAPMWAALVLMFMDTLMFMYVSVQIWGFYSDGADNFRVYGSPPYITKLVTFGVFAICMNTVRTLDKEGGDEYCSTCYALTPQYMTAKYYEIGEPLKLIMTSQLLLFVAFIVMLLFIVSLIVEIGLAIAGKVTPKLNRKIFPLVIGTLSALFQIAVYITSALLVGTIGHKFENMSHFANLPMNKNSHSGFSMPILTFLIPIVCNILALICFVHNWGTGRSDKEKKAIAETHAALEKLQQQQKQQQGNFGGSFGGRFSSTKAPR
ncbi:uncharacterized protein LOC142341186 [Convolutriloba macropyga]|uniref:uncharacterized protein LOC142341186 n=1 Tax=Convolutriloba macropyga TaxID=536237 RepID=UPI003F525033